MTLLCLIFICSVKFPFLTLLISGGHSLLALVKGVDDFVVIGKGLDDAPGDALDKVTVILGCFVLITSQQFYFLAIVWCIMQLFYLFRYL